MHTTRAGPKRSPNSLGVHVVSVLVRLSSRNQRFGMDGMLGDRGCGCCCSTTTSGSHTAGTAFPARRTTRAGPGAQVPEALPLRDSLPVFWGKDQVTPEPPP